MCEKKRAERAEATANGTSDRTKSRDDAGCPCEPKRCLPLVGAVLAAVAVPLVILAIKNSSRSKGHAAGCCS